MNPGDLHTLILLAMQFPIVGAFALGIWYADRRAQQRGERIGALEDRMKDVEAALGASRKNG